MGAEMGSELTYVFLDKPTVSATIGEVPQMSVKFEAGRQRPNISRRADSRRRREDRF